MLLEYEDEFPFLLPPIEGDPSILVGRRNLLREDSLLPTSR